MIAVLRHLITTTSECEVNMYLRGNSEWAKRVFVLTSRIPDDCEHLRYDVFQVVKAIEKD